MFAHLELVGVKGSKNFRLTLSPYQMVATKAQTPETPTKEFTYLCLNIIMRWSLGYFILGDFIQIRMKSEETQKLTSCLDKLFRLTEKVTISYCFTVYCWCVCILIQTCKDEQPSSSHGHFVLEIHVFLQTPCALHAHRRHQNGDATQQDPRQHEPSSCLDLLCGRGGTNTPRSDRPDGKRILL